MKTLAFLTVFALGFMGSDNTAFAADKDDDKKVQKSKSGDVKKPSADVKKRAVAAFKKAKAKEIAELKKICKETDVPELKKICPDLIKCEEAVEPGKHLSKKCEALFKKEQDIYDKLSKAPEMSQDKEPVAKKGKSPSKPVKQARIKPRNRDVYYEEYYEEYVDVYGEDAFYVEDYEDEYMDDEDDGDDGDDEDDDDEDDDDDDEDDGDDGDDDEGDED